MTAAWQSVVESPSGAALVSAEALRAQQTFVVVAAYNEGPCIADVVSELRVSYPNVVVVDDGSKDATAERAQSAGAWVLTHLINRGQGAALQTGISYALARGAQYIVTFDADGQHDVADIAALLDPIARGEVETSLGSRFLGGRRSAMPPSRRVVLFFAVLLDRKSTSELQSQSNLVCRLLLEKKKKK